MTENLATSASLPDMLLGGLVSLSSTDDSHCVRVDFGEREDAEKFLDVLTGHQLAAPVAADQASLLKVLLSTRNALVLLGRNCPIRDKAIAEADAALAGYRPFDQQMQDVRDLRAEAIAKGWMADAPAPSTAAASVDAALAERVEAKWLEIRENLNALHGEKAITYGELKHGVNMASLMRDAILGEDSGAEPTDLVRDAERFRALMRCPRIKMQGSCGFDPKTGEIREGTPGGVHFGAEFWPIGTPHASGQCEPSWGHHAIRALADDIIAVEQAQQAG